MVKLYHADLDPQRKREKPAAWRLLHCLFWILTVSLIQGCVVVPKTADNNTSRCQLLTKKLTLDVYQVGTFDADQVVRELDRLAQSRCDKPECLLVYAPLITVAAGSAIVSGSLVIVGNTLHWLEEQGRCDESTLRQAVKNLSAMATDAGGWVVESSRELISWFSAQTSQP